MTMHELYLFNDALLSKPLRGRSRAQAGVVGPCGSRDGRHINGRWRHCATRRRRQARWRPDALRRYSLRKVEGPVPVLP